MDVFVTLHHVHFEHGEAIGAALTLKAAQAIADAHWMRMDAAHVENQLGWGRSPFDPKSTSTWVGRPAGDWGRSYEVQAFACPEVDVSQLDPSRNLDEPFLAALDLLNEGRVFGGRLHLETPVQVVHELGDEVRRLRARVSYLEGEQAEILKRAGLG